MPRETWCTGREPLKSHLIPSQESSATKPARRKGKGRGNSREQFLRERFEYLATGSSGIKCLHFILAWTERWPGSQCFTEERKRPPTAPPESAAPYRCSVRSRGNETLLSVKISQQESQNHLSRTDSHCKHTPCSLTAFTAPDPGDTAGKTTKERAARRTRGRERR